MSKPPTTAQVVTLLRGAATYVPWAAKKGGGSMSRELLLAADALEVAASLPDTHTPEGEPFREHVIRVMADVMGECRIARDSTKGSMFEQVADELRFARMQITTLLEKLKAAPSSAPQEPVALVETIRGALQELHSAIDEKMGDSELPDDESRLMLAMQRAAPFLGDAWAAPLPASPTADTILTDSGVRNATPDWRAYNVLGHIERFRDNEFPALPASSPTAPPLNALAAEIHAGNKKWWYQADGVTPLARNKGELLMLVVTEVAEAMEGERKNLMDDKLPHRRMAEVEIVDAIVRLLDYAAGFGYELDDVLREKLAYNATRADHKAEAARLANGTRLIDSLPASAPASTQAVNEAAGRVAVCKMLGRLPEAVGGDAADDALRIDGHARASTDFAEAVWGVLDAFNLKAKRNANGFLEFWDGSLPASAEHPK